MKTIIASLCLLSFSINIYAGGIDGVFEFKFGEYFDRSKEKFSSFEEYLPGIFRSLTYVSKYKNKDSISDEYQLIINRNGSVATIIRYETLVNYVSMDDAEKEIDICSGGALGLVLFYSQYYGLPMQEESDGEGLIKSISYFINDGRNSIRVHCNYQHGQIIRTTKAIDSILRKTTNSRL